MMRATLLALTAIGAATASVTGLATHETWTPGDPGPSSMQARAPETQTLNGRKGDRLGTGALPVELIDTAWITTGATGQTPARNQAQTQDQNAVPAQPAPSQPPVPTTSAQTQNPAQAPAATPAAGAAGQPKRPVVDESALRYFAARGDTVRLQAEISRLRALYPGWEPPADPLSIAAGADQQLDAMWKLYSEGRYDDVDKAIAERQKNEPGWTPPPELIDSLRLSRSRRELVQASDARRYDRVVELASSAPQLLTCSEVDVLWRVGEAFAKTDRPDRARDAYAYILQNCNGTQERLATMQKASLLLDAPRLDDLLKLEQTGPDGKPEFDAVRDDIARTMVSRGGADPKVVVPEDYVTRLGDLARRTENASDSMLLGWYHYRRNQLQPAQDWFRRSFDKDPSAMAAQGLALTQIGLGDPASAENTLYRFRDSSDDTKAAYLAAVANLLALDPPKLIDNAILARMAPPVIEARSRPAAEQFGWYARLLRQMRTAADWFQLVLSWDPSYEPAAYGLALSLDALGDRAGVARLQAEWAGRSERITYLRDPRHQAVTAPGATLPASPIAAPARPNVEAEPLVPEQIRPGGFVLTQPAPQPVRATAADLEDSGMRPSQKRARPRGCSTGIDLSRLSPSEALPRGWCLMNLQRPLEAAEAFERAMTDTSATVRQDAAYGKSLAYLRLNLADKAAVAAVREKQSPKRANELQAAILAERAIGAFRLSRYTETIIALDQRSRVTREPQDLMMLRAAAYGQLGYRNEARKILQALANVGNRQAIDALIEKPE